MPTATRERLERRGPAPTARPGGDGGNGESGSLRSHPHRGSAAPAGRARRAIAAATAVRAAPRMSPSTGGPAWTGSSAASAVPAGGTATPARRACPAPTARTGPAASRVTGGADQLAFASDTGGAATAARARPASDGQRRRVFGGGAAAAAQTAPRSFVTSTALGNGGGAAAGGGGGGGPPGHARGSAVRRLVRPLPPRRGATLSHGSHDLGPSDGVNIAGRASRVPPGPGLRPGTGGRPGARAGTAARRGGVARAVVRAWREEARRCAPAGRGIEAAPSPRRSPSRPATSPTVLAAAVFPTAAGRAGPAAPPTRRQPRPGS